MNLKARLEDRRVAVLAADGFEMVELMIPVMALRRAGAEVDIISLRPGRIRGVNLHEPARRVRVTKTLTEARPEDYDALLIPGGFISPDLLRQSAPAREFVKAIDAAQKPIATLCHGPWVLASAGLMRGRMLTSWPGIRDDLVNAGGTWLDQDLVYDRNWVSSRGPQDMRAFVNGMINLFAASSTAEATRAAQASSPLPPSSSAPQRSQPPKLVLTAMKWAPRPSIRTAAMLMLLGVWVMNRSRSSRATDGLRPPRAPRVRPAPRGELRSSM